ncbi:MAG: protein kinase [Isosphaeraceae bacterium]
MDPEPESAGDSATLEDLERLIPFCDEYEARWKAGEPVPIGDLVARAEQRLRPRLLRELIALELELRRGRGDRPVLEEYRARFPGSEAIVNEAFAPRGPAASRPVRDPPLAPPRGLHLCCPHCQHRIELLSRTLDEEVVCPSCGSSFPVNAAAGGEAPTISIDRGRRTFGRFRNLRQVGTGAFGTVYRAHDPQLDRVVAVKIPRASNLEQGSGLDRFPREARSAAQLSHPRIVAVHEFGEHEGVPYIVSDFIEGVTLSDWLTARHPSIRDAAALIAEVADAIEFAHEHGVVHRDLKPSNLMIDALGRPHVMDFGLAKREAGEITVTEKGDVLGTPAYMSPEQARGDAHLVDRRSDVYSLGVILYKLLTRELPFRGNARMLIHQVLNEEPRPPRALNDRIPRDLETICLKCMAKEPERRYPTAGALRDDLRRWLDGQPIEARPASRLEKGIKWVRRYPLVAGSISSILIVSLTATMLVTLALFYALERQRESDQAQGRTRDALVKAREAQAATRKALDLAVKREEEAVGARSAATRALEESRRQTELAKRMLYDVRMGLVQRAWEDDEHWQFIELMEEQLPANQGGADRRGFEWYYWYARLKKEFSELHGFRAANGQPPANFPTINSGFEADRSLEASRAWIRTYPFDVILSPGGDLAACQVADRSVRIWRVATGQPMASFKLDEHVTALTFNRTASRLAMAERTGAVQVVDIAGGKVLSRLTSGLDQGYVCLAFRPDDQVLAAGAYKSAIDLWDLKTNKISGMLEGPSGPVIQLAFTPDGRYLASCSKSKEVILWDHATGRVHTRWSGHSDAVTCLALSQDGRRVATGARDGSVKTYATPEGSFVNSLHVGRRPIRRIAFSRGGEILTALDGQAEEDRWIQSMVSWDIATGEILQTQRNNGPDMICDVVAPPDRDELISLTRSGLVRMSGLSGFPERRSSSDVFASVDPDLGLVAYQDGRGEIRIGDLDGRELRSIALGGSYPRQGGPLVDIAGNTLVAARGVWSTNPWKLLRAPDGKLKDMVRVALSGDGRRLATVSDRIINGGTWLEVEDLDTGRIVHRRSDTGYPPIHFMLMNRDGSTLILASRDGWFGRLEFDQDVLYLHSLGQELRAVALDTPARTLAAGYGSPPRVELYRLDYGSLPSILHGFSSSVTSLTFFQGESRLAAGCEDGTLRICDLATDLEVLSLRAHLVGIQNIRVNATGELLCTVGTGGRVAVWRAPRMPASLPETSTMIDAPGLLRRKPSGRTRFRSSGAIL